MIGMFNFWENYRSSHFFFQRFGDEVVIQTPAFVSCSRTSSVAPPRILVRLVIEMPETVGQIIFGHKFRHPVPFHWEKPGSVCQPNWIVNIDGLMTNVEIAADDEIRNCFSEFFDVL